MNIELLYRVADAIKTGWELCDSVWQNSEAETIACQAICSCRLNHKEHGDALSWQGIGTQCSSGNGLVNNLKGMHSLLVGEYIILEQYKGKMAAPQSIVIENGFPIIIKVTDKLLEYAAKKIGISEK